MAKRPKRKAASAPAGPLPVLVVLGPLAYLRRSWKLAVLLLLLCLVLTLLTQVGGVVLWLTTPLVAASARRLRMWSPLAASFEAATVFLVIYGIASLLVVPPLAAIGGRVPLPCFGDQLQSRSMIFCALNRHYVRRDLRTLAGELGEALTRTHPGARLRTLDAGFPFLDGFPLLPHLSHRNGTALDLALFYRDRDGRPASSPSPIGYQMVPVPRGRGSITDEAITRDVLRWLNRQPHMSVVRSNDHIHLQIKP